MLGRHDPDVRRRRGARGRATLEALVRAALERARKAVRPGDHRRALTRSACDIFEDAGHRTSAPARATIPTRASSSRSATASAWPSTRRRRLGPNARDELVAGDVIAIEPGLTVAGLGEVRLEDLLLVTADGSETLTSYPYDLMP